ncbi:MAG: NAD(P)-dependent oxidoreductase [Planctomycetes bacterium]|nr:NAD(P)-dependent oxidoreductase [Planctomycetota bacterium]
MKKLKVAVTGGSGRIGGTVVEELVRRGHKVVNLDRRQADKPLAKFVFCDLTKREQVQTVFEQVEAVCHLGEIPGPWNHSPEEVFSTNTRIGSVVMQTAADLKLKRVIYTSTCQVYGPWGDPVIAPKALPVTEAHPLLPQNAYGLSKVANEQFAEFVARKYGLSIAIFRFPRVWNWDPAAFEDWQKRWLESETGPVEELGAYLIAQDAARAYACALERPRPGCEAYHFAAREALTFAPIRERLRVHHAGFPALPSDWPKFKCPLVCDKARAHLGWTPKWNLLDLYRKRFGKEPDGKVDGKAPAKGAPKRRRRGTVR